MDRSEAGAGRKYAKKQFGASYDKAAVDAVIMRVNDFEAFMQDRQKKLLTLIERATGKAAYTGEEQEEGVDVEADDDTMEAELIISGE
jgi:hypothetical protein